VSVEYPTDECLFESCPRSYERYDIFGGCGGFLGGRSGDITIKNGLRGKWGRNRKRNE